MDTWLRKIWKKTKLIGTANVKYLYIKLIPFAWVFSGCTPTLTLPGLIIRCIFHPFTGYLKRVAFLWTGAWNSETSPSGTNNQSTFEISSTFFLSIEVLTLNFSKLSSPCLNKLSCCRVMGSLDKISVLTDRSLLKVYLLHYSRLSDDLMLDCINICKFKHESECVCIFLNSSACKYTLQSCFCCRKSTICIPSRPKNFLRSFRKLSSFCTFAVCPCGGKWNEHF